MKLLLLSNILWLSYAVKAQERTVMSDLGKVGALHFTLARSDTSNSISITQGQTLFGSNDLKIVVINENEITEVVQHLNSIIDETAKKTANNTVITYKTKNLLLSCSYFKINGWTIIIQNMDPALDSELEKTRSRSGIQINNFVEIKPDQLKKVIQVLSKVIPAKAV